MSTEPDFELSEEQAQQLYTELGQYLSDQESKFDANVMLIGGGAFTVSVLFMEKTASPWYFSMFLAWVALGISLLVTCGSFLVSSAGTRKRIAALRTGQRHTSSLRTWNERALPVLSAVAFASLLVGLVFFGYVVYRNADNAEEGGKEAHQEALHHQARRQGAEHGKCPKHAADTPPANAVKEVPEKEVSHVNQGAGPASAVRVGQEGEQRATDASAKKTDRPDEHSSTTANAAAAAAAGSNANANAADEH